MTYKIGFIGCGNMGEAILAGSIKAHALDASNIYVFEPNLDGLKRIKETYHVHTCKSNKELYEQCDVVLFAIKPNQFEAVVHELKHIDDTKLIISIAVGVTIEKLRTFFDCEDMKIIRVMPNTPALVNIGASGICASENVKQDELDFVKGIFDGVGVSAIVKEEDIHAVVAVSGSSPAYGFMFLDAIIEEGVREGLSYDVAKQLGAQTLMGAAKMVMESDETPNKLKENVCSPNGTTLEAVKVLEEENFKEIVMKAMRACSDKSKAMSK